MNGTVTDRSGGTLPGVTVTIHSTETGLQRMVTTNKDGYFTAPFLPIGKYDAQAELAGFGTMRHRNVRVDLNQTVVQDFRLVPASVQAQTTVNVTDDDGPVVDTSRIKVGGTVTQL